jgi:hypothetical protein
MTEADRAFYEPWYARMRASYTKSQAVQNRVSAQFTKAAQARGALIQVAEAEEKAARHRADHAAAMRQSRGRAKARTSERIQP